MAVALAATGVLTAATCAAIVGAGGVDLRGLGVPLAARSAWPSLGAAVLVLGVHAAWRRRAAARDVDVVVRWLDRRSLAVACALAAAAAWTAVGFGTFAAGGSDSYCYVEQAERWAAGTIRAPIEVGFTPDWSNPALSLTPTGFVPSRAVDGAIAPICPAGLSLLMAVPRVLGAGRESVFYLVPLFAALCVVASFVAGRRLGGGTCGLLAAVLTAASPVFLYQAVQPMSDVPAAACWIAALALAGSRRRVGLLAAGLACGLAVLIRPNLAPLVGPFVLYATARVGNEPGGIARLTRAAWMLAGLVPAIVAVGMTQQILYGSVLRSGYGSLDLLFRLDHVVPNLARYPGWLVETQSPWILLGLAAPAILRAMRVDDDDARGTWLYGTLLWVVALATFAAYVPYVPFDDWWFLRFWLPGIPPLIVLTVGVVVVVVKAAAPADGFWRGPAIAAMLVLAVGQAGWQVRVATDRAAFGLEALERKFVAAGEYVRRALPDGSVVLTVWHSGSARYYGGRDVVLWDAMPAAEFDHVVSSLASQGRQAFLLLETWERQAFQARLMGVSAYAALDWPPRAIVGTEATLWSLADRERFLRGEPTPTDRIWIR